jgi:OmpA family
MLVGLEPDREDVMKRHLLLSAACCVLFGLSAQAQEGRYVVLFAFDQASLDATAQATLAAAAQEFQRTGSASISVVGHTDTSGNASYNQALSERREQAVSDELMRLGVPASALTGEAVGEAQPVVQTGDGIAEAQNRRVDIQIAPPPPPPAPQPAPQVAQPAPPPPPAPKTRWMFTPGIFYGYNIEDEQGTHSHLAGINLSLDYLVTDWLTFGIEQAGFYHFDTDKDGPGGRTVVGPDLIFGDPQFAGYFGGNIGYLYGSGFDDDLVGGPEVGLIAGPINWKIGYDIPFNRDLDEGIVNTTIGAVFRF